MHHSRRKITLPSMTPGSGRSITVHSFGRAGAQPKVYLQAAIHANELPGAMALHHLMPMLVEAVNQRLLYGRMPAGMKQALINAAAPGYDAKTRIVTVLYLTALSGQFAVQY